MAKFNKKAFRAWLDALCATVVKVRDRWTCQKCGKNLKADPYNCHWCHIKSRSSNSVRWQLPNCETLCGTCHQFAHANPDVAWDWLFEMFPNRKELLNKLASDVKTWRQDDFEFIETYLLGKAKDFKVKPEHLPEKYRKRFERKISEVKNET